MNPSLAPGAQLTCILPDGNFLLAGQTYVVREVIPDGKGGVLIDVSKGGGWPLFWPGRFKLAEWRSDLT